MKLKLKRAQFQVNNYLRIPNENMKKNQFTIAFFTLVVSVLLGVGCNKNNVDSELYGSWILVNDSLNLTRIENNLCVADINEYLAENKIDSANIEGTELIIGEKDITLKNMSCLNFEHQQEGKVKVYARDGQIWYIHKLGPFFKSEVYIFDYTIEGKYIWLRKESTDVATNAKLKGVKFSR